LSPCRVIVPNPVFPAIMRWGWRCWRHAPAAGGAAEGWQKNLSIFLGRHKVEIKAQI
jgi:hypothetical protein